MSWLAAGTTLGSAVLGNRSAKKSAKAQTRAMEAATAEQRRQFDETMKTLQPRLETEGAALNSLTSLLGLGGQPADPSAFTTSPGYEFALQGGQQALERSAAARGGQFSGNTLAALSEYGTGMANQEYGNYVNQLLSLAGMGTDKTAANLQQNHGNNMTNLIVGQGGARASGIANAGASLQGGLAGVAGLLGQRNMLSQLRQPAPISTSVPSFVR